ncbi:MarR family winged helix-turn-helix transcriptional regulator [Bacillus solimangrovi]|nr:MarR family transcriptional regulator [Bacillus solimangrovi]
MEQENSALKLFVIMMRAHQRISDAVGADVKGFGLNPTEFGVLELLYHKGDTPLQKIGEKILLASGSITYVVDKLEGKGLLERKSCPSDRRVTYAGLTEQGRALIDDVFPKHAQMITDLFSVLSTEEQQQAAELIKKLGHHSESIGKK